MITKWEEFRRNVFNWRAKRLEEQRIKVNNLRERSIKILQKRYGYTREKATDELDTHYSGTWLG